MILPIPNNNQVLSHDQYNGVNMTGADITISHLSNAAQDIYGKKAFIDGLTTTVSPADDNGIPNLGYIKSHIKGFEPKGSVDGFVDFTTAEPAHVEGKRYVNTVTGTSSGTSVPVVKNYIYTSTSGVWVEEIPQSGWVILNTGETQSKAYYFDSFHNEWDEFGLITEHNLLTGLQGGTTAQYYHLTSAQHTSATREASDSQNGLISADSHKKLTVAYDNACGLKEVKISATAEQTEFPFGFTLKTGLPVFFFINNFFYNSDNFTIGTNKITWTEAGYEFDGTEKVTMYGFESKVIS